MNLDQNCQLALVTSERLKVKSTLVFEGDMLITSCTYCSWRSWDFLKLSKNIFPFHLAAFMQLLVMEKH
jgi:hypothetical protein